MSAIAAGTGAASGGAGSRRLRHAGKYAALVPFHLYVAVFLLLPTLIVAVGAFQENDGAFTFANIRAVFDEPAFRQSFVLSLQLSVITALAGSILGALLAWTITAADPEGWLRRIVVAASGVLAQFGGVMLAFGFLATFQPNGFFTSTLRSLSGINITEGGGLWLYRLPGLSLVYLYFQIPLMLIVFLPAIDGLRREWRDASVSLGGTGWSYWRHIAGPILAPTFLGATLLLFTNAFSAYATAAALVSQGSPIAPLQIRTAMTSEVILGQANVGKALALAMIVIVAIVMTLYAIIQRRASRWVR